VVFGGVGNMGGLYLSVGGGGFGGVSWSLVVLLRFRVWVGVFWCSRHVCGGGGLGRVGVTRDFLVFFRVCRVFVGCDGTASSIICCFFVWVLN
jgi:hypothetical protein